MSTRKKEKVLAALETIREFVEEYAETSIPKSKPSSPVAKTEAVCPGGTQKWNEFQKAYYIQHAKALEGVEYKEKVKRAQEAYRKSGCQTAKAKPKTKAKNTTKKKAKTPTPPRTKTPSLSIKIPSLRTKTPSPKPNTPSPRLKTPAKALNNFSTITQPNVFQPTFSVPKQPSPVENKPKLIINDNINGTNWKKARLNGKLWFYNPSTQELRERLDNNSYGEEEAVYNETQPGFIRYK